MKIYFVAKTAGSALVGAYSIPQIAELLRDGKIQADYVATEFTGTGYAQLVKQGGANWFTVAQLTTKEPGAHEVVSLSTSREPANPTPSMMARYRDAYLVGRTITTIGAVVKSIGIILALIIALAVIFGGAFGQSNAAYVVIGLLAAAVIGVTVYVWGILVAAQGEILKASLDQALNTSPFLTDQQRAEIMSLV